MEKQVLAFARQHQLLPPPGGTLICALSGGADSMCLTHLMAHLGQAQGFAVVAAHFDHMLRPESAADRDFAARWCGEQGIPLVVGRDDVAAYAQANRLGTEEAGRILRYRFLEQTAEGFSNMDMGGEALIATAHNANDNAETLLLHLVRGSGLHGLTGIPPRRGRLVRPLLEVSRRDILDYLSRWGIPHVEDSTNGDTRYFRNYLRREVIPLLEARNPSLIAALGRTAAALREDDRLLEELAVLKLDAAPGWVSCGVSQLSNLAVGLQMRAVQQMARQLDENLNLSAVHRKAVLSLLEKQSGSELNLPEGFAARRDFDRLTMYRRMRRSAPLESIQISLPGELRAGDWRLSASPAVRPGGVPDAPFRFWLCRGIGTALCIRPRHTGDRLVLPHRGRGKTVKKWMIEEKIPAPLRNSLPVLTTLEGTVAAVAGLGADCRFSAPPGEDCWLVEVQDADNLHSNPQAPIQNCSKQQKENRS